MLPSTLTLLLTLLPSCLAQRASDPKNFCCENGKPRNDYTKEICGRLGLIFYPDPNAGYDGAKGDSVCVNLPSRYI